MCIFIHINFLCIVLNNNYFNYIQICFKPIQLLFRAQQFSWGALPPETPAEGLRALTRQPSPPQPAPLMFATLAVTLIMFSPGMSVFYLILLSAGFSEIYPGHNKTTRKIIYYMESLSR